MTILSTAEAATLALIGLPGYVEVLIILGAILILFGGKKLPELARGLGKSVGEFKKGLKGMEDDAKSSGEGDEAKTGQDPAPEEPEQGTGNKE